MIRIIPIAEAIFEPADISITSLPSGNLEDTRLKLYKYDEHSGAAQIGWPKLMTRAEVDLQNREYASYTSTGREDIQCLLDSGLQTLFAQKVAKTETQSFSIPSAGHELTSPQSNSAPDKKLPA